MARNTAYRTVFVKGLGYTKIVAKYNGGIYIDLHWFDQFGQTMEVINVYDYRAARVRDFNVSAELTNWLKENGSPDTLANYYRNTV